MWKRGVEFLCCLQCGKSLELFTIEDRDIPLSNEDKVLAGKRGLEFSAISRFIETGILFCPDCKVWHPVVYGLPIMLPYATNTVKDFEKRNINYIKKLGKGYSYPQGTPAPGEMRVLKSFTREWLEYPYDEVLWSWSYDQREAIFLGEIGVKHPERESLNFLEIGCGLGVVTSFGAKHLKGDAIGVDLSGAVARSARHFQNNPFLHFIQASLWNLPLKQSSFDMVYSHGALHHTYSTKKAFQTIARFCKPGGYCYIWIYGSKSINENTGRKLAYGLEAILRPVLSRVPSGICNIFLYPLSFAYVVITNLQKIFRLRHKAYTLRRGLHAARDRFTPLFAHRTQAEQARSWFEKEGFEEIKEISLSNLPPEAHGAFRRNVGIRGQKI